MSFEALIEAAYRALLDARTPSDKALAGAHFTALVQARNAERTPQEIARLERKRGLS